MNEHDKVSYNFIGISNEDAETKSNLNSSSVEENIDPFHNDVPQSFGSAFSPISQKYSDVKSSIPASPSLAAKYIEEHIANIDIALKQRKHELEVLKNPSRRLTTLALAKKLARSSNTEGIFKSTADSNGSMDGNSNYSDFSAFTDITNSNMNENIESHANNEGFFGVQSNEELIKSDYYTSPQTQFHSVSSTKPRLFPQRSVTPTGLQSRTTNASRIATYRSSSADRTRSAGGMTNHVHVIVDGNGPNDENNSSEPTSASGTERSRYQEGRLREKYELSSDVTAKLKSMENKISELEEECKVHKQLLKAAKGEITRCENIRLQQDEELTTTQGEAQFLRVQLQMKSAKAGDVESKLLQVQTREKGLLQEVDALKEKCRELEEENSRNKDRIHSVGSEIPGNQEKYMQSEEKCRVLLLEKINLQSQISELQGLVNSYEIDRENMEENIETIRRYEYAAECMDTELQLRESQLDEANTRIATLSVAAQRTDVLEEELRRANAMIEGLQSHVQAAQLNHPVAGELQHLKQQQEEINANARAMIESLERQLETRVNREAQLAMAAGRIEELQSLLKSRDDDIDEMNEELEKYLELQEKYKMFKKYHENEMGNIKAGFDLEHEKYLNEIKSLQTLLHATKVVALSSKVIYSNVHEEVRNEEVSLNCSQNSNIKQSRTYNLILLAGLQAIIWILVLLGAYIYFVDFPKRTLSLCSYNDDEIAAKGMMELS